LASKGYTAPEFVPAVALIVWVIFLSRKYIYKCIQGEVKENKIGERADVEDLAPFTEAIHPKHRSQFVHHEDYFRKNYNLSTVTDEWLAAFKHAEQARGDKIIEDEPFYRPIELVHYMLDL